MPVILPFALRDFLSPAARKEGVEASRLLEVEMLKKYTRAKLVGQKFIGGSGIHVIFTTSVEEAAKFAFTHGVVDWNKPVRSVVYEVRFQPGELYSKQKAWRAMGWTDTDLEHEWRALHIVPQERILRYYTEINDLKGLKVRWAARGRAIEFFGGKVER